MNLEANNNSVANSRAFFEYLYVKLKRRRQFLAPAGHSAAGGNCEAIPGAIRATELNLEDMTPEMSYRRNTRSSAAPANT